MTPNYMNKAIDTEISAPIRQKLEAREVLDGLMSHYYENEASISNWLEEQ
jgi:hypothetical protein